MGHRTAKTPYKAILQKLGQKLRIHSRPISAHGPHGGRRPWLGRIDVMEKESKKGLQSPKLQSELLQIVRIPSNRWSHNDSYGLIVRLDRNATCFSSTHAMYLSTPWYVDDLMAVSPISSYLTDSSKVDKSVQHLLGEGSITQQKSQCARQLEFSGWILTSTHEQ